GTPVDKVWAFLDALAAAPPSASGVPATRWADAGPSPCQPRSMLLRRRRFTTLLRMTTRPTWLRPAAAHARAPRASSVAAQLRPGRPLSLPVNHMRSLLPVPSGRSCRALGATAVALLTLTTGCSFFTGIPDIDHVE